MRNGKQREANSEGKPRKANSGRQTAANRRTTGGQPADNWRTTGGANGDVCVAAAHVVHRRARLRGERRLGTSAPRAFPGRDPFRIISCGEVTPRSESAASAFDLSPTRHQTNGRSGGVVTRSQTQTRHGQSESKAEFGAGRRTVQSNGRDCGNDCAWRRPRTSANRRTRWPCVDLRRPCALGIARARRGEHRRVPAR